jgi:hypothetical protein
MIVIKDLQVNEVEALREIVQSQQRLIKILETDVDLLRLAVLSLGDNLSSDTPIKDKDLQAAIRIYDDLRSILKR